MKIADPIGTSRVTPAATRAPSGLAASPAPARTAGRGDTAAVLGIPEAELTPRVQGAIASLLGELQGLRGQLDRMMQRVADLERLADRDTLTPLVNRRAFLRELERTAAHVGRHGSTAALALIDLDGLKAINDSLGHAAGDAAILQVGEVLTEQTRRTDLVGRLGGDEFVVLFVQSDVDQARAKMLDMQAALARRPLRFGQAVVPLDFSFGVQAVVPEMSAEALIEAADKAMYRDKQARREKTLAATG